MTTIYLVRHGETMWNKEGRIQGHRNVPLSPSGIEQGKRLAEKVKNIPIDWIYSSDLERALHTAQLVAEHKQLPVNLVPELRERFFGEWEGLTSQEIEVKYPGHSWDSGTNTGGKFGIEKMESLIQRADQSLLTIAKRHKGQHILVVSHGGLIRAFLRGLGTECDQIGNTSITQIVHVDQKWKILKVNDMDYL
ncbi:histidine phosphatase family protein [Microaerobacter geothermalis]|uniref:histidine phosphatase family protein n=1 Tax=Microaerobacter geothermalis TaxID=674972 RepID=UPI001F3E6E89|nr:histidine phosphatase family protein [Microaerobacter geothermalis]MCF6094923.1 histidine phosphatase family protein [Microaerobacter geothermalis]